ncbi:ATP-binding cassette sub- E member 1 [Gurleya vavrai]
MAKNTEKKSLNRLAIIDPEVCKPDQCNLECKRSCPVNKIGKSCITVTKSSKISIISEILCIGCGACVKKCPFNAITIINLPTSLDKQISHRYTVNGFKLHRLPVPKMGSVLGLVGTNGIGKSTALKILSGEIKPNLGNFNSPPDWLKILDNYKGSELHSFFTKLLGNELKSVFKIQYIDKIPKSLKKEFKKEKLSVSDVIKVKDEKGMLDFYVDKFRMRNVSERDVEDLSGGELQRFACLLVCIQKADIYFFDEPSSYLDVKQRIFVAEAIRSLQTDKNYIIVVEHDLAILDLMCDYGCVLYGKSGAYGVITSPFTIKQGINVFLEGYIPNENMKFRTEGLMFNISERPEKKEDSRDQFYYPSMDKTYLKSVKEEKGDKKENSDKKENTNKETYKKKENINKEINKIEQGEEHNDKLEVEQGKEHNDKEKYLESSLDSRLRFKFRFKFR